MPKSIKIRGIEPPDYGIQPELLRRQFWTLVVPIALRVKDQELAAGLDAHGDPLRPIAASTRKYRHTAMRPSGKGSPEAPPLMPAYQKSRVRALLAGRALTTHAELYWRYDPFIGASFDRILNYQRDMGRDVFGVSDEGIVKIRTQAWAAWTRWKKSGKPVTEDRTAVAAYALGQGPQTRIAQIIAGSAKPHAQPVSVPKVGSYNMDTAVTSGGGGPGWTGGMTAGGWRRWMTAEMGTEKPPKPTPKLQPKPKPVAPAAAKPKPQPKEFDYAAFLANLEAEADRIEAQQRKAVIRSRQDQQAANRPVATAEEWVRNLWKTHPGIVEITRPIADRIKAYTWGDTKIRAIQEIATEQTKLKSTVNEKIALMRREVAKFGDERQKLGRKKARAEKAGDTAILAEIERQFQALDAREHALDKPYRDLIRFVDATESQIAERVGRVLAAEPRERLRVSVLDSEPQAESAYGLKPISAEPALQARANQAANWLGSLATKGDGLPVMEIKIGQAAGIRAHYRDSSYTYQIQLAPTDSVDIAVHELGHALEYQVKTAVNWWGRSSLEEIGHSTKEFYRYRTQGESTKLLRDLYPDGQYELDEAAREDKFKDAFGNERSGWYAGKDYTGNSTELLSMGLELLYKDPVGFSQRDPEYCKLILGVLDGSLRGKSRP